MIDAQVALSDISEAGEAFRAARRITAICHENPDADTVGAAVAVCIMATQLGIETELVSADGIPPVFAFLPYVDGVRPAPLFEPDLAVVCDAATLERVGRIAQEQADWFARARLLNIDHHLSSTRFGDINLVDVHAAATCEVLARLVDRLGLEVTPDLATALLTGIVRDSHGFSDPATSGDTLRVAASLVDAGAPLALIHRRILSDLPFATMALWGKMLADVGQRAGGHVVHTTLRLQMLSDTGTEQHDADGLAEFLFGTKDADVVVLFRELDDGSTRVSLRTSERVDATRIAAQLGGGGHARRAGAIIPRPVAQVAEDVLAACERAVVDQDGASSGR